MKLNVSTSFKLNKIGVIALPQPSSKSISEWSERCHCSIKPCHPYQDHCINTHLAKNRLIVFTVAQGESLSFQSLVSGPDLLP
jgi:hypothetical protein